MKTEISAIQKYLKEAGLDGWLLADFHGYNHIAVDFLGLGSHITRRSFYFIPTAGEPMNLINPIEQHLFTHLPGHKQLYFGYKALENELKELLKGVKKIAMEYSASGRLPYVGLVDAGTIEMVRNLGVEIVSSADLVSNFQARLDKDQIELQRQASANVLSVKDKAFAFIKESLESDKTITEYDVTRFVMNKFESFDMETDHSPICGVDGNAGNPHYEPTEKKSTKIGRGQLVLLDLWAKLKQPSAPFADITWMAFTGTKDEIPKKLVDLFSIVANARDAAVTYLKSNFGKKDLYGADVDDAVRQVMIDAGYGKYFVHRTGHSITTDVHGVGPNIDNLETEDRRVLMPGHLFSVEPGLYFDDCGFRSEIDVLITEDGPVVTTLPPQAEITALF